MGQSGPGNIDGEAEVQETEDKYRKNNMVAMKTKKLTFPGNSMMRTMKALFVQEDILCNI